MADAIALRLHRYCVHCSSGLVGGGPRYVCPIAAYHARRMGNAGWCVRDNHQPIPVFLAGITGSRGDEVSGTQARANAMRTRVLTRGLDIGVGTFFSNVGMYFIILTTALTLHRDGTHIQTSE